MSSSLDGMMNPAGCLLPSSLLELKRSRQWQVCFLLNIAQNEWFKRKRKKNVIKGGYETFFRKKSMKFSGLSIIPILIFLQSLVKVFFRGPGVYSVNFIPSPTHSHTHLRNPFFLFYVYSTFTMAIVHVLWP